MKKRICIIIVLFLFTTGCTCEYNLTIDGSKYDEEIRITADNEEEKTNLNMEWEIPIDKEEYNNYPGDSDTKFEYENGIYEFSINDDTLIFNNLFNTRTKYSNSTAVSICYDLLSVERYNDSVSISTSKIVKCFEKYNELQKVVVNIKTTGTVTYNNADSINNGVYSWYINKEDTEDKEISLIIKDKENTSEPTEKPTTKEEKKNYSLYIFLGVLLIFMLLGYAIFSIFKKNSNKMNDV